MAIRKDLVWTVSDDLSISPDTPLEGGVQGEDKAVRAKFILGTDHPLAKDGYRLYIECEDASGGYDKTEAITLDEEGALTVEVPLAWTQYGGQIRLSIAAEGEDVRVVTDAATIAFRNRTGMLKRMQAVIQVYIQRLLDRAEDILKQVTGLAGDATNDAEGAAKSKKAAEEAALLAENAEKGAVDAAASANNWVQAAYSNFCGAQFNAQQASTSAKEASTSATAAAEHCRQAEAAASAAGGFARSAQSSAAQASSAASEAGEFARSAQSSEEQASSAASDAKSSASKALTYQTTAKAAAESAQEAADRAEAAGGGAGVLVVTWDGKRNTTVSHTAAQIYEHTQNGGTTLLHNTKKNQYWAFSSADEDYAQFGYWDIWDECHYHIEIDGDGAIELSTVFPINDAADITIAQSWLDVVKETARANIGAASAEDVGNIDEALDAILAIQNTLIGGDA